MMTDDKAAQIISCLGSHAVSHSVVKGELTVIVGRESIQSALRILRDDAALAFSLLIDICGADYPDRPQRFEVIYHLLSVTANLRVRLKLSCGESDLVPSVSDVFSAAGWYEREVWDMYGVSFAGNPDLRRILTDYGFEGHPQRKDFPLTGFVELRYDEAQKRVVYEPVKLQQDYRSFDALSPWEGMTDVQLPGDEKAAKPKFGWKATRS